MFVKKEIIKIKNLEYSYPGHSKTILNNFNENVFEGEIVGIVGRNGSGKSTILRLLASLSQPLRGNVLINGIDSQDLNQRRDYLSSLIYISHDKVLLDDYTIKEYFQIYSSLYPNYSEEIEKELMIRFSFDYGNRISSLSTGNRMKVFMVFALATQVKLILIDEVTAVLDPENRVEFYSLINRFQNQERTFLIATNIVEELGSLADRVWFLKESMISVEEAVNVNKLFIRNTV